METWIKWLLWIILTPLGLAILLALGVVLAFLISDRTNGEIRVSTGERRLYLLHVPKSYDPEKPTPLVISIHGYMDWPAHQAQMTGWNKLADEQGFIVVYPSGLDYPKHWRASSAGGETAPAEVVYISELIDKLEAEYNIDPERIYANGLSNGGGMTFLLACTLSDRIAAVGLVAGAYLLPWEACQPSRPVPAIVFHGTADPIVPYLGGPSRSFDVPFPNIPSWVEALAQHNGCKEATSMTLPGGKVKEVRYSGCAADVIFYIIEGGGHTWPGGKALPVWLTGTTSKEIDATRVMWEFFQAHPK